MASICVAIEGVFAVTSPTPVGEEPAGPEDGVAEGAAEDVAEGVDTGVAEGVAEGLELCHAARVPQAGVLGDVARCAVSVGPGDGVALVDGELGGVEAEAADGDGLRGGDGGTGDAEEEGEERDRRRGQAGFVDRVPGTDDQRRLTSLVANSSSDSWSMSSSACSTISAETPTVPSSRAKARFARP